MDLRAQGDRDLAERLLKEHAVRKAIEELDKKKDELGARRHLLATALRLTREMSPDIHDLVDGCRRALGIDTEIELYVYPDGAFNAAAVRPEGGRLFLMFSSGLLEGFEPAELEFVIGHELGHHLFDHHAIPVAFILRAGGVGPELALTLFAWQRYAEISCDRAGLRCAGGLEPAAHALFKLASGLRGGRVKVQIDQFLAQASDMRDETDRLARATDRPQRDWFTTHPFSPLRLRAVELCARSELLDPGGMPRVELEARIDDLMNLMNPSYLHERSEVAEAMRRLLVAGTVAVAEAAGGLRDETVAALEKLLGDGAYLKNLDPEALRDDLDRRIEAVRELVPPLRRAQVVRDLCLLADTTSHPELGQRVIARIARQAEVEADVAACATCETP